MGKKTILFYNAIPMPHSLRLQKELEDEGYQIYFWYYKNLTNLYPWKNHPIQVTFFVFSKNWGNVKLLLKHFFQSDFLIITGWHTFVHIFLAIAAKLLYKKFAYWTDVPIEPKRNLFFQVKKFLLKQANYVFVTGKTGISLIHKWYEIPLSKLKDFPYLSAGDLLNNNLLIEKSITSGPENPVKGFIANRFEPRKGYKTIYEAFNLLFKNELKFFSVKISGIGSEFSIYKDLFKKFGGRVELLGWVSYDDYLNQMLNTDIFIHASDHEPYGIPPIDAMELGKLVVASTGVYSALDRIENGVNGFVFNAGDSQTLASILKSLKNNYTQIKKMGALAKETTKKYTPQKNIEVLREILN